MNTGVAHRRGFAIIVLLAAVALAAWLVQARLGTSDAPKRKTAGNAPAAAPAEAAPAEAPAAAPGDDGYGAAPAAPAAPAPAVKVVKATSLSVKKLPRMGEAVVDQTGEILYRFDTDGKGQQSKCNQGGCAEKWPPIVADNVDDIKLTGIDKSKVTLIPRADGTKQVAIGDWNLYQFAGSKGPGTWPGQGAANGTWWVVTPTGARNTSCAPKGVKVPTG